MNKFPKYITLLFIAILLSSFKPTDDIFLKNIISRFNSYSEVFHLQKVFVHTDKEKYIVKENIWFKTYLLDGTTHRLDSISTNIYIELINPSSEIIQVRLLKINKGASNGYFYLPDSLPTGNYQIRAFTNLMKNFNNEYLFTKTISIFNKNNFEISKEQYRRYKKLKRRKNFINIIYYPEDKELIYNIKNKISIKSVDYSGAGIKSKGYVVDNKKNIITEFETNSEGNSFFYFTPLADKKYKLVLISAKGKKKKFKLPEIKEYGYVLDVNNNNDFVNIVINPKLKKSEDKLYKTFYLIAQSRGKIIYTHSQVSENKEITLNIEKNKFPTGIIKFTILNNSGKVQAEQLLFVNNNDNFEIEVLETKINNNYIELKIRTLNNKGNLITANLSLSVNTTKEAESQTDIVKEVLINSDLKNKTQQSNLDCDSINYLINSNVWDKYKWENILKTKQDALIYKKEKLITISGYITRAYLSLPVENSNVVLSILSTFNDSYTTFTDKKGKFAFKNLDYKDTIEVFLEARNERDKKYVLVYKDDYDTIPIFFNSVKNLNNKQYALRNIKKEDNERTDSERSLHGTADQVIYFDEIETAGYTNIFDILKSRVPGMQVSGNSTTIRGFSSINQSSEPLYLINNVPAGRGAINSMNVEDVERVEIVKSSAKNAIYGSRGGNGVIAVYTKKGHNIIRGHLNTYHLGYHVSKKFYFSEIEYDNGYYPTYFWQPEIKTNKNDFVIIKFQLPKNTSSYKVNIQGVSETGTVSSYSHNFNL